MFAGPIEYISTSDALCGELFASTTLLSGTCSGTFLS